MEWVPVAISLVALVVAISAEIRARRAETRFAVELDSVHRGRIVVRNTGSKRVKRVFIDPISLAGVRFSATHINPTDLIPGDKIEVWVDEPDHDQIPNTIRVRFGRFTRGERALKVSGDGRPVI